MRTPSQYDNAVQYRGYTIKRHIRDNRYHIVHWGTVLFVMVEGSTIENARKVIDNNVAK